MDDCQKFGWKYSKFLMLIYRYVPRAPPAYQLPPPPPAPPSHQTHQRRRHGSFSESHHAKSLGSNPGNFHFRSRSSSGRFRHMKTPNDYFVSRSADQLDNVNNNNNSEPIYSEPFPLESDLSVNSKRKFFPDPHDPVQISHHIYEYLVSKRGGGSQENLISVNKRRGSLSSSPSDGSSTNNSKPPDFSSGKQHFWFILL